MCITGTIIMYRFDGIRYDVSEIIDLTNMFTIFTQIYEQNENVSRRIQ